MPVTEINHVNFRTDRQTIDVLRDFYCDILGLKVGPRIQTKSYGYWLYIGDNDVVHLSDYKTPEPPALHVNGPFDHVSFTCTDMPQMQAWLTENSINFSQRTLSNGVIQLNLRDPAGNGVELNFEEYRNLDNQNDGMV